MSQMKYEIKRLCNFYVSFLNVKYISSFKLIIKDTDVSKNQKEIKDT